MDNKRLKECINYVTECTQQLQLSRKMFMEYRRQYNEVYQYCVERQLSNFTLVDAENLCLLRSTDWGEYSLKTLRKAAYTTAWYMKTGNFIWKSVARSHYRISEKYEVILDDFRQKLLDTLSPSTARTTSVIVRKFLYFLEQNEIYSLSDMATKDVLSFVSEESSNHKASMGSLLRATKKFIHYLCMVNITDVDVDKFLTVPIKSRQKALPCFTNEEILAIFSEIDRSSDKGRRDYAVFLLALRTGLRASDIAKLKLSDINWNKGTICIVQEKTKKVLHLPLPLDVGNAIADYILHSRYKTENPYVFLRFKGISSMQPLEPTAFNCYLKEYMKSAGIIHTSWDGKTFHALRRTAGTSMIKSRISVSTVSQILGHSNIESTKRYIALDAETLRECCMELGPLHTKKEGLF